MLLVVPGPGYPLDLAGKDKELRRVKLTERLSETVDNILLSRIFKWFVLVVGGVGIPFISVDLVNQNWLHLFWFQNI